MLAGFLMFLNPSELITNKRISYLLFIRKIIMVKKNQYKRKKLGYSIAILIGFDEQIIHFWKIFSQRFKHYRNLNLPRKWKNCDEKQEYHYHEDIIDILRPLLKEGVKSILLAQPRQKDYSQRFLDHIQKHHPWLIRPKKDNQVSFGQIIGKATNIKQVKWLMEQEETEKVMKSIRKQEGDLLVAQLQKALNNSGDQDNIFYGLSEIEDMIYEGGKKDLSVAEKIDYMIITDTYLENHKEKGRIYRLKQIAENKGIITKIFSEETPVGFKIQQFGGILCFKK